MSTSALYKFLTTRVIFFVYYLIRSLFKEFNGQSARESKYFKNEILIIHCLRLEITFLNKNSFRRSDICKTFTISTILSTTIE